MLQQPQVGMEERQTKKNPTTQTQTRTNPDPDPDQPGPGPGPTSLEDNPAYPKLCVKTCVKSHIIMPPEYPKIVVQKYRPQRCI